MKYKLTKNFIEYKGKKLYQIEALKHFEVVKAGNMGGYIESEDNLSQEGNCWIYDNALVYGKAKIYDDAKIYDNAEVCGNLFIS